MFAGAGEAIECSWPVAALSMMGTSRILQFPFDPAQSLLGECFNIRVITITKKLHKSGTEKLSSAPVPVALQTVPVAFIDAQQPMQ